MAKVFPATVDGERITGDGELGVTLLSDIEQFGAVAVRSAPDGVAPSLHAHARHAEAFFLMEGELTFRLEDGEHRVGPGTWVFVPPEVVHTFAVTGTEPARFLDIHEGEKITDRPERRATVLVDADELIISEFAYGSGERGATPHVHHEHADAFLVVEGEFTFTLRDGPLAIPAGTLLLIPPDVVHGFDNDSPANARCFNFHAPSLGFGDYLRGRNPDFDQHDPPADGGADPASAIAVRLG